MIIIPNRRLFPIILIIFGYVENKFFNNFFLWVYHHSDLVLEIVYKKRLLSHRISFIDIDIDVHM